MEADTQVWVFCVGACVLYDGRIGKGDPTIYSVQKKVINLLSLCRRHSTGIKVAPTQLEHMHHVTVNSQGKLQLSWQMFRMRTAINIARGETCCPPLSRPTGLDFLVS